MKDIATNDLKLEDDNVELSLDNLQLEDSDELSFDDLQLEDTKELSLDDLDKAFNSNNTDEEDSLQLEDDS
ncbi:MAG: hypothetical protein SO297_02580, partial [Clostridium paraputrificum]